MHSINKYIEIYNEINIEKIECDCINIFFHNFMKYYPLDLPSTILLIKTIVLITVSFV